MVHHSMELRLQRAATEDGGNCLSSSTLETQHRRVHLAPVHASPAAPWKLSTAVFTWHLFMPLQQHPGNSAPPCSPGTCSCLSSSTLETQHRRVHLAPVHASPATPWKLSTAVFTWHLFMPLQQHPGNSALPCSPGTCSCLSSSTLETQHCRVHLAPVHASPAAPWKLSTAVFTWHLFMPLQQHPGNSALPCSPGTCSCLSSSTLETQHCRVHLAPVHASPAAPWKLSTAVFAWHLFMPLQQHPGNSAPPCSPGTCSCLSSSTLETQHSRGTSSEILFVHRIYGVMIQTRDTFFALSRDMLHL
ncbi:uncharacterized protein LOC117096865 [Trachypithecus francoisi]|uniref:uncharacterized protein LOC117096865 n=1 Tax=Trachypithecus francoisi TaxID=54180 RepID=UPI00141B1CA8|nr:uncharacterized protein LOC117096865 [Trachypithecus francoisi]